VIQEVVQWWAFVKTAVSIRIRRKLGVSRTQILPCLH